MRCRARAFDANKVTVVGDDCELFKALFNVIFAPFTQRFLFYFWHPYFIAKKSRRDKAAYRKGWQNRFKKENINAHN